MTHTPEVRVSHFEERFSEKVLVQFQALEVLGLKKQALVPKATCFEFHQWVSLLPEFHGGA